MRWILLGALVGCQGGVRDGSAPPGSAGQTSRSGAGAPTVLDPTPIHPAWMEPGPWQAGDSVPGWEDYDCEDLADEYEVLEVNQISKFVMWMDVAWGGGPRGQAPMILELQAQSCPAGPPCDKGANQRIWFRAFGSRAAAPLPRGLGWYVGTVDDCSTLNRTAAIDVVSDHWPHGLVNAGCVVDYATIPSESYVCLSRVRPDEVAGEVWIRPYGESEGGWVADSDSFWLKVPFRYLTDPACTLGPHSFEFDRWPAHCEDNWTATWILHSGYGEVWPWDEITNPYVRATLFDTYRPTHEIADTLGLGRRPGDGLGDTGP